MFWRYNGKAHLRRYPVDRLFISLAQPSMHKRHCQQCVPFTNTHRPLNHKKKNVSSPVSYEQES